VQIREIKEENEEEILREREGFKREREHALE